MTKLDVATVLWQFKEGKKSHTDCLGAIDDYVATIIPSTGEDVQRMAKALKQIADWELPATGKFWDEEKTRPTSYETEYGSNGVRDYIRSVAKSALAGSAANPPAPVGMEEAGKHIRGMILYMTQGMPQNESERIDNARCTGFNQAITQVLEYLSTVSASTPPAKDTHPNN